MANVEVIEEQTTWDPRGVLTTTYVLGGGMEVLHHVSESESSLTYQPSGGRPVKRSLAERATGTPPKHSLPCPTCGANHHPEPDEEK